MEDRDHKRFLEINRTNWDERVGIHLSESGDFYRIDQFVRGGISLQQIELEELGDVTGKRLLHLMCHFGLDTLSWARLGALPVGVDFSPKAIEAAQTLRRKNNLQAKFICSEVADLPSVLDEEFDIAIATYGVLCWLPDKPHLLYQPPHCDEEPGELPMDTSPFRYHYCCLRSRIQDWLLPGTPILLLQQIP